MEHVMDWHRLTKASKYMAVTVIESYCKTTDHNPQPLSTYIVNAPFTRRSEIEHVLADPGVMRRADVARIVENPLTNLPKSLKQQMVWHIESTFEDEFKTVISARIMTSVPLCSTTWNKHYAEWSYTLVPVQY